MDSFDASVSDVKLSNIDAHIVTCPSYGKDDQLIIIDFSREGGLSSFFRQVKESKMINDGLKEQNDKFKYINLAKSVLELSLCLLSTLSFIDNDRDALAVKLELIKKMISAMRQAIFSQDVRDQIALLEKGNKSNRYLTRKSNCGKNR